MIKDSNNYILANNLKFAFKKTSSPVAYCALTVAAGSRVEDLKFAGLAHMCEHMLFKGTKFHTARYINSVIENLGGELNAYTSKEEIVIYSTVLNEDLHKAIRLLFELAFTSIFPEKQLEKEKQVVLDEISSYEDSPAELIYDDFEERLFKGTDLSHSVLGTEETVKRISPEVLLNYIRKYFVPENISFTVVANTDQERVKRLVNAAVNKFYTASLSSTLDLTSHVSRNIAEKAEAELSYIPFTDSLTKDTHQAHCIIGTKGFSYYQEDRIPLAFLINILGGPASNSKLNMALRERHALVYSVEASYNQFCETGCVSIYFGSDKEDVEKCINLIYNEIKLITKIAPTEKALRAYKKQFLGQMTIAVDNAENNCLSMGKSLMVYGNIKNTEDIKKEILDITAEKLLEIGRKILAKDRLSTLIYI
ncbi:MAG: pitrilysin family protein [Bacteroidales bacterium]